MSYFRISWRAVRADRLVSIVLLLQAHGQLTVSQIAQMLEVSERTVRRDLDSLCVAGVPVYSQRGRGGGWALIGGHRLDLSGFTVDEARALFLVAGSQPGTLSGLEPALGSAMRKVFTALPEPLRVHATTATQAAVVDPMGWGRRRDDPPFVDEIRRAVLARTRVVIDYAKPGAVPSRRKIQPLGLVAKGGVWYLLAGTDKGRRTFRVSRIKAVEQTSDPVELPEGFDLRGEWESAEREFLASMQMLEVKFEVAERSVLAASAAFRGWSRVEEGERLRAGWRSLVVHVPSVRAAAVQLAGFGSDVRVESPQAVRDELARIGEELVGANA
jgi:predicted DNA-binding transcriptional regulator YafY